MAWTPPVHIAPGSEGSSAQMNAQVMDNLSWLYTNPYRASMHAAAAASILNTTALLLPVDTVDYDPSSMVNTAQHIITVPVKGYYDLRASARLNVPETGVLVGVAFYLNATGGNPTYTGPPQIQGPSVIGDGLVMTREVLLNAGDQIGVQVWHNAGSAVNLDNGWGGSGNSLQVILRAQST